MSELISVVVPAYNVEPYLDNCLNSILKQTYSDIEILLVDDGSTDNTLQVALHFQSLSPDKIHVIHTGNQGVTMARFEGIRASRGEWIGFVDGDDEIEPDMYERLYNNAKKYKADISHCGHMTVVNGGERVHYFYNTGHLVRQDRNRGLKELIDGPIEPGLWSKLFRRDLIQGLLSSDLMDTSIKYNEDLLMNFFLFRECRTAIYEDFCGYRYMAHTSSVTRSRFRIEKVSNPVRVWKTILEYVDPEMEDLAWKNYLMACVRAYWLLAIRAEYKDEASGYRAELINNRSRWKLLTRNNKIKLRLILLSPILYNKMYQLYERYIQRKIFE